MARITRMTKRRLGELLQAEGLVSEAQVRTAHELQRKENLFLSEALVKLGYISEEAIAHTIVQQFSLPFMSANQCNIGIDVLAVFPERMYYEYQFIAADKIGQVLLICGAGLMNHDVLDELERLSGCKVCQYVSTWKDIRSALEKYAKDMRKSGAEELSDLGSMLFDSGLAPRPVDLIKNPEPPPQMKVEAAALSGSSKSSGKLTPVSVVPNSPPMPTPIGNLAQNTPFNRPAATVAPRGPVTHSVPKSALAGTPSQRQVSTTPGSNPNNPAVLTAPPFGQTGQTGQTGQAGQAKDKDGQPVPPPKTGLLGLFKKS